MGNEIHIALAPDDKYTEHAVVCAISVLENMRDSNLVFHILDGGLCEASKRSFLVLAEVYKNVQIIFEHPTNNNQPFFFCSGRSSSISLRAAFCSI